MNSKKLNQFLNKNQIQKEKKFNEFQNINTLFFNTKKITKHLKNKNQELERFKKILELSGYISKNKK